MSHTAGCVAATAGVAFVSTAAAFSLILHPAGLEAGPAVYTPYFAKMFPGIAKYMGTLVVIGTGASLAQAAGTPATHGAGTLRNLWLSSAALLASVLPWTAAKMMPVNNEIMQAAADGLQAKAETLEAWGPLHAVRVAAGTASAGIMIYALARTK